MGQRKKVVKAYGYCFDCMQMCACDYLKDDECTLFNVSVPLPRFCHPMCDAAFGKYYDKYHEDVIVHAWRRFCEEKEANKPPETNWFIKWIRSKLKCVFS
jgi:hypothetical protein